jgi:hypothetical protein
MLSKTKSKNASKQSPNSCMTHSCSQADPAKGSAPTGVPEGSVAKTKSKGKGVVFGEV